MVSRVEEKDLGFRALRHKITSLQKYKGVEIGFFREGEVTSEFDPKKSLVDRAIVNNYGAPNANPPIPARPFFDTFKIQASKGSGKLGKSLDVLYALFLSNPKLNAFRFTQMYAIRLRKSLRNIIMKYPWIPNSPVTIAKKGSSRPLIDTKEMFNGVKYEIKKRL